MAAALRDRITLVHKLLSTLNNKGAAHAKASETQGQLIAKELLSARISLQEATEFAEQLAAVPWHSDQHREVVLEAASSAAQRPNSVSANSPQSSSAR